MARPALPLRKTYGKLTTGEEWRDVDGRRMVLCTCTCGRQREVYVPFLNSGRVTSCGNVLCRTARNRKPSKPVSTYHPRMPKGFTPARLRKFWKSAQKLPPQRLAERYKLPTSSTYMLLDRLKRYGDVEKFLLAVGVDE